LIGNRRDGVQFGGRHPLRAGPGLAPQGAGASAPRNGVASNPCHQHPVLPRGCQVVREVGYVTPCPDQAVNGIRGDDDHPSAAAKSTRRASVMGDGWLPIGCWRVGGSSGFCRKRTPRSQQLFDKTRYLGLGGLQLASEAGQILRSATRTVALLGCSGSSQGAYKYV
jgi:hypothetical protein